MHSADFAWFVLSCIHAIEYVLLVPDAHVGSCLLSSTGLPRCVSDSQPLQLCHVAIFSLPAELQDVVSAVKFIINLKPFNIRI